MKKLIGIFIVACSLYFVSCFSGSNSESATSIEEIDAKTLLQKADDMVSKGYLNVAANLYDDALRKFTLIDNGNGKAKCIAGKIKVYSMMQDKSKTNTLLHTLSLLTNGEQDLNELLVITQIESVYFYDMYDSLMQLTQPGVIKILKLENQAAAIAYRLNIMTKLKNDASKEKVSLEEILPRLIVLENDERLENPNIIGFVSYSLAYSNYQSGNYESALHYAKAALETDKRHSSPHGIADDLFILGKIVGKNKSVEDVENYYQRAYDIYVALDDKESAENVQVESLMHQYLVKLDTSALKDLQYIYKNTKFGNVKSKVGGFLLKIDYK